MHRASEWSRVSEVEAAGDHHHEGLARLGSGVEAASGRIELDGAESVEPDAAVVGLTEHCAGARPDRDPAPVPRQAHEQGRDDLDRGLEGIVDMGVGSRVEHDHDVRFPVRRVLADEQLAGARGRGPVDLAQVVADLVLAQRRELVALQRHRAGPHGVARRSQTATAERWRREVVDAGIDRDLVEDVELGPTLREAERIGERHDHRPDRVLAPPAGRDPVRGA